MANTVGRVEYKVSFNKGSLTSSLTSAGKRITAWGNRISGFLGGLLGGAIFHQGLQSWKEFQAAMRQVNALEVGKSEIEELNKLGKEIAETYGWSAAKAIEAFYYAASAGRTGKAGRELVRVAAQLTASATAAGEALDNTAAAKAIITVLNAFKLETSEAAEAANALNNAVQFGITSINQLSGAIPHVASLAKSFGVSYKDILIATAAATQPNIPTKMVAISFKAMISEMAKSSTKVGQAIQQTFGQSFAELTSKGVSLMEILQQLNDVYLKGATKEFVNLFGGIRAGNIAIVLANEKFKTLRATQEKVRQSTNSLAKGTKAYLDNPLTAFNAGMEKIKTVVGEVIDSVGGLGEMVVLLAGVFSAFKVANFISKLFAIASAYSAVAIAHTAAKTGPAAIAAIPAVIAALAAGATAAGSIWATTKLSDAFSRPTTPELPNQGNKNTVRSSVVNRVVVNNSPEGTNVLVNGQKTNAQTNFGGG
jgi:TP901 family phage tail tape measure protein